MESFIEEVSTYLDVDPVDVLDRIKDLPKLEDLTDLQARMDCLLKENVDLRAKAEECDTLRAAIAGLRAKADEGETLRAENAGLRARAEEGDALRSEIKELKDRMREVEKEAKAARMERDRSKEVAQRVSKFLGSLGDVLNKARLFDHSLKQPATDSRVKMMRCMIDYSQKMEKTLKELRSILKPAEDQPGPTGTPGAGPSTTPAASFVTPPVTRPDPLLQEPIPVLNTDEMANLRDWAARGPEALTTPTGTGQNPGTLSTPGSVSQEQQRREEERTKKRADEEESESSSSEEEGESPITLSSDEEEYEGSDTPSDPGRPKLLPYQVNRPVTRSTPTKRSSRSKRKAAQQKEQGRSSSKIYKRRRG